VVWNVSKIIAVCSLCLVLLAVLVTAIAGHIRLLNVLSLVVPQSVQEFFEQPTDIVVPTIPNNVKATVGRAAPRPADSQSTGFSIGAAEIEVLKIQGRPSRVGRSTWFYGESEVQFVAGRVIAWKNSSKNPLRIR
jgi:hypothetical protein